MAVSYTHLIFGDIFGDLFGGRRGSAGARSGPMKGANLRTSVRITFEEAVFGTEKEIELTVKEECKTCHGTCLLYTSKRRFP